MCHVTYIVLKCTCGATVPTGEQVVKKCKPVTNKKVCKGKTYSNHYRHFEAKVRRNRNDHFVCPECTPAELTASW
ncbi:uncharacterized protein FTOL_07346 [Fusarium torulosum]|uniref:Uncharacterized protein n=1 Tax=Fusarium torulosum TaxID=33205 RepID=A0AAE8SJC7_9HYPO|nr:uncharacterized protein FTOL_07346 [Fusarium torulosum]